MQPEVIKPFKPSEIEDMQLHVAQVRRLYDWPGATYHDAGLPPENRFNRWYWHNVPLLREYHHQPDLIELVSHKLGRAMKPSYVFLSMYGPDGVCPLHTDRPQCQATVDLLLRSDPAKERSWPIHIRSNANCEVFTSYILREGEAVFYSGTDHPHYRDPISNGPHGAWADLAFFHFVPTSYMGPLS